MPASIRPRRAAVGDTLLRLVWLAACAAAAYGQLSLVPTARRAGTGHAVVLAATAAEQGSGDAAVGGGARDGAVLLAITGADVDSVTPVAGVRAAVMPMGGTTHLLLTGRLPGGAAARAATVWTAAGDAPTIAVAPAVGGAPHAQRAAAYVAALR